MRSKEEETDQFRAPVNGLQLETRVVLVCLVFFEGVEKDEGVSIILR